MTTSSAAGKAGHSGEKEKEKTGIRRALGRGLESLLPGPRVVRPAVAPAPPRVADPAPLAERTKDGAGAALDAGTGASSTVAQGRPAPHLRGSGAAGEQQVPHFVRNDKESSEVVGTIEAVVEAVEDVASAPVQSPAFAKGVAEDGA